ncbi:Zn-dependent hydrolase [Psychrosphaera aquimarina]|uniref:Zn-dependent hydrolase n=1 Tax=Psychrosphaera aquimarina TaxID=2044854 RepID=A0ABU3R0P1_9GAMM|nr:Zn-dependent hydrolase [Psychrosphaera aquimarina]MDU0113245.1 Zn-dependent hydrolase [Psychrosphaera aquimarina]
MTNTPLLNINGERLWQSLMDMAQIGATKKGGCNRQALTDLDKQGRDLFITWCEDAGMTIRIDEMGNIFARRAGTQPQATPVITGSHLDTQPTGGKFDGVYGVLAGLEVVRTLNDNKITTQHPLEIVVWTNEEGARFSPAMIGSGIWSGEFDLDYGWNRKDKDGCTIKQALTAINMLGETPCLHFPIKAAYELHIEQGPILEQQQLPIGVVEGVQGIRWYDLIIKGSPVHAGPTPMKGRQDPIKGLADITSALYKMVDKYTEWSRVTFGNVLVTPASRNTVPEQVTLWVDLRHPENENLTLMDAEFRAIAKSVCEQHNLEFEIKDEWHSPAVQFNQDCVDSIEASVQQLGYPYKKMFSGAGHDSVYVSKVAPTAMIFIPCEGGISHNEAENVKQEDITSGCNVLLGAMTKSAGVA